MLANEIIKIYEIMNEATFAGEVKEIIYIGDKDIRRIRILLIP